MPPSTHGDPERLTANLIRGGFLELYLTPKPGLVDLSDSGSHHDLSLSQMEDSMAIVAAYLLQLRGSIAAGESLKSQIELGMAAEKTILEEAGTSSHRGYVFLSGLFLIAHQSAPSCEEEAIAAAVSNVALQFFAMSASSTPATNGSRACALHRVGGIKAEALRGLPSLFKGALPAYRAEIAAGGNRGSATFAMLARLMQTVEDTTALHRCGRTGLARVREDGRTLERLVREREDFLSFLTELNRRYIQMNLTIDEVGDLLALAFAWLCHTGELEHPQRMVSGSCNVMGEP